MAPDPRLRAEGAIQAPSRSPRLSAPVRARRLYAVAQARDLGLAPVAWRMHLTLLFTGWKAPGAEEIQRSYISLAQYPARKGAKGPVTGDYSGSLKPAGKQIRDAGLWTGRRKEVVDKETKKVRTDGRGTPFLWTAGAGIGTKEERPDWRLAGPCIATIATSCGIVSPNTERVWCYLALTADQHGWVRFNGEELARITGLTKETALKHVREMAAKSYGIDAMARIATPDDKQGNWWEIQLAVPPTGEPPQRHHDEPDSWLVFEDAARAVGEEIDAGADLPRRRRQSFDEHGEPVEYYEYAPGELPWEMDDLDTPASPAPDEAPVTDNTAPVTGARPGELFVLAGLVRPGDLPPAPAPAAAAAADGTVDLGEWRYAPDSAGQFTFVEA